MILLIDNYDSFSYNLYQLIGTLNPNIRVARNDSLTPMEIDVLHPECIIISPGPGRPREAGYCESIISRFADSIPILGVCLGHQALCEAMGGAIIHARELMHGKASELTIDIESPLFCELPQRILGARYHSLAVQEESLPDTFKVIARSDDGEIMAVSYKDLPVYGLQFHPESILTPQGYTIIRNFLRVAKV
jgi:anthranilate synthase component 2